MANTDYLGWMVLTGMLVGNAHPTEYQGFRRSKKFIEPAILLKVFEYFQNLPDKALWGNTRSTSVSVVTPIVTFSMAATRNESNLIWYR